MSNSVINQEPFSGVCPSRTPHEDSTMQDGGQDGGQAGSLGVTMKAEDQQSAVAEHKTTIDSHPTFSFSLWWERWRREARTRFPMPSIRRHS
jgi:hypothetical protein